MKKRFTILSRIVLGLGQRNLHDIAFDNAESFKGFVWGGGGGGYVTPCTYLKAPKYGHGIET